MKNIGLLASAALLLNLSPAQAANNDLFELSLAELLKVHVSTATMFEESNLDSPSSISSIRKQDWELRGTKRTKDVVEYLPGLNVYETLGGAQSISMRGFTASNPTRVSEVIDGIPINHYAIKAAYFVPQVNLGVLDKVEVISGPASTLYGSDAFSGVLSMHSYESSNDEMLGRLTVGNFGRRDGYLNMSKQASKLKLDAALAYESINNQEVDYIINNSLSTTQRDEAYESTSAIGKLAYHWSERDISKFAIYHIDSDMAEFSGLNVPSIPLGSLSDSDSSLSMFSLSHQRQLSEAVSLTAKTYNWNSEHSHAFHTDPLGGGSVQDQFTEESRRSASIIVKKQRQGKKHQVVAGLEWDKSTVDAASNTVKNAGATTYTPRPYEGFEQEVISLFLQGDYRVTQALSLTYGMRFDDYESFGEQFSPKLGLVYRADSHSAYKLIYGQGFKAPSAKAQAGGGPTAPNLTIEPETIDTYELVYMYQNENLNLSITGFYSKWQDAIQLVSYVPPLPSGHHSRRENVGESYSYGLEFDIEHLLFHKLSLAVNGSYVRSFDDSDDSEYELFPRLMMNALINYYFSDNNGKLFLGLRTQRDMIDSRKTTEPLDHYYRVNMGVSQQFEKTQISLNLRNLFDKELKQPSLWGLPGGVSEPGRTIELSLKRYL